VGTCKFQRMAQELGS